MGMGVGFTAALVCMAIVREVLGSGTFLAGAQSLLVLFGENTLGGFNGFTLDLPMVSPMLILVLAPGGFFTFGMLMACANKIAESRGKPKAEFKGCEACPMANNCSVLGKCDEANTAKEDAKV